MTRILMRRVGATLSPIDEVSAEGLKSVRQGEVVTVTIKKPQNPKLLAFFWALVRKVYENQERYATEQELVAALKVAAGARTVVFMSDGREVLVPKSISADEMDDIELRAFVSRVCDVVAAEYLIDVREPETRRDLEVMIGARAA